MIETSCPFCGKAYRLKPELAGHSARCRGCSRTFQVPLRSDSRPDERSPETAAGLRSAHSGPNPQLRNFAEDETDPLSHPDAKRIFEDEDWYSPAPTRTKGAIPVKSKRRETIATSQVVIAGTVATVALGAGCMIFWLAFLRGSKSDSVVAGSVEATATAAAPRGQVAPQPRIATEAQPQDGPAIGGNPANAPAGSTLAASAKPDTGDRLAVFRLPGDLPYGQFPEEPEQPAKARESVLKVLDHRAHIEFTSLLRSLESAVSDAKTANNPESIRFMSERFRLSSEILHRRFQGVVDLVSRTTLAENAAIHEEFGARLATAIHELEAENRRVAQLPGQSGGIFPGMDKILAMHKRIEKLTNDRRALDPIAAAAKIRAKKLPIDPISESNYAEIRVAGLESDEARDLVLRRIREIPTIRKTYTKIHFDAPYRVVVWPVDSLEDLAVKLDFGEVLRLDGKEIWVWAVPLPQLKAQRDRLVAARTGELIAQNQAAAEMKRREIEDRERTDREADQFFEHLQGQTQAQLDILLGGKPSMERMIEAMKAKGPVIGGTNDASRSTTGATPAPTMPPSAARPSVDGGGGTPKPAVKGLAGGERPRPKPYENVEIALIEIQGSDSSVERALETLRVVDLKGKEPEVIKAMRRLLSESNAWTRVDEILSVLDRCPGPERAEIAVAHLDGKFASTTNWIPALARWKEPSSIEPIARHLEDVGTRWEISAILVSFGPAAEKSVLKLVTHSDVLTRNAAWEVLKLIGGRETIATYRKLQATGQDELTGRNAVEAILERQRRRGGSRRSGG